MVVCVKVYSDNRWDCICIGEWKYTSNIYKVNLKKIQRVGIFLFIIESYKLNIDTSEVKEAITMEKA